MYCTIFLSETQPDFGWTISHASNLRQKERHPLAVGVAILGHIVIKVNGALCVAALV